jgi:uncharacterized protein DUF892
MGLFTKDVQSMEDLFLHTLRDIYYAENQIVKSLPTMIEKSTNRQLAKGLCEHLRETEGQVARLDKVFEKLGEEPKGTDCPAIDGLIKEAKPSRRRDRRQKGSRCCNHRLGPSNRALRDFTVRHPHCVGGDARPRQRD